MLSEGSNLNDAIGKEINLRLYVTDTQYNVE